MSYIEFSTEASWLDLTPLFSVPVDNIMREIDTLDQCAMLEERDQDQYKDLQARKASGVGAKIQGQQRWSAMALFSASGQSRDIISQGILDNTDAISYRSSFRNLRKHRWTDLAPRMLSSAQWLASTFEPLMRLSYVKIAKLDGGGTIPEHADLPETGRFSQGTSSYTMLNSILIELNHPPGVSAMHGGVLIPYTRGSVFMLNQSRPHSTVHSGTEPRYNIRIHGLHNTKFREMIRNNISMLTCHPPHAKDVFRAG